MSEEQPKVLEEMLVTELIVENPRRWDFKKTESMFGAGLRADVGNVRILQAPKDDRLIWPRNEVAKLTISLATKLLRRAPFDPSAVMWEKVWKSKIHESGKMTLWRLGSNCFLVAAKLRVINNHDDGSCRYCGQNLETLVHLFFLCDSATRLWFSKDLGKQWTYAHETRGAELHAVILSPNEASKLTEAKRVSSWSTLGILSRLPGTGATIRYSEEPLNLKIAIW